MVETNGVQARVDWHSIDCMIICLGELDIMSFRINPRYNRGNARRPKTQAVYLSVHHPQGNRFPIGGNLSFKEAFDYMRKATVPQVEIDRFITYAIDEGWGDDYEIQKTQTKTLF